jgi:hypothetical protein
MKSEKTPPKKKKKKKTNPVAGHLWLMPVILAT